MTMMTNKLNYIRKLYTTSNTIDLEAYRPWEALGICSSNLSVKQVSCLMFLAHQKHDRLVAMVTNDDIDL